MLMNNDGFLIQNNQTVIKPRGCIVVVGLARGGTSAVACSLASLGIHMGDEAKEPTFEDSKIISTIPSKGKLLLGARAWDNFATIASQYSEDNQLWGLKYPSIHNHLFKINTILNNPRYIFVYRDVFATSSRRSTVDSSVDQLESMENCLRLYNQTINFIRKEKPIALHLSYEKILTNTKKYAEVLSTFCNQSPSEEIIKKLTSSIMPSPESYRSWSYTHKQSQKMSVTNFKGRVHTANSKEVYGWATNMKSGTPVTVEIFVNGELHGRTIADKNRPQLFKKGVTLTSKVGFHYNFGKKPLAVNATIKVLITGTDVELINSGKRLEEYQPQ